MSGNIFQLYIRDANKSKDKNKTGDSKDLTCVTKCNVVEVKPTIGAKIISYLKNETFMDIIN